MKSDKLDIQLLCQSSHSTSQFLCYQTQEKTKQKQLYWTFLYELFLSPVIIFWFYSWPVPYATDDYVADN